MNKMNREQAVAENCEMLVEAIDLAELKNKDGLWVTDIKDSPIQGVADGEHGDVQYYVRTAEL